MFLTNTDYVSGKNLEMLGLVTASTVQTKHFGKDLTASFKTLVGGEIEGYTEMMEGARKIVTNRMIEQAKVLGADAIVNIKYSSSAVMQGAAEVLVYGTAVKYI